MSSPDFASLHPLNVYPTALDSINSHRVALLALHSFPAAISSSDFLTQLYTLASAVE